MNDNKLIAEFMGYDIITEAEKDKFPTVLTTKDVKYHSSWDYLMPVVHKIRVPYNNTEITGEKYEDIISVLAEGCVEANQLQVYEAVIEFIKTYNNDTI